MLIRFGMPQNGAIRHFMARYVGLPAGISTLLLDGELSGIYYVATSHNARKKGIGSAVTWAALDVAQREGCQTSVLEASTMGYSVYHALGFRDVCTVRRYDWTPQLPT